MADGFAGYDAWKSTDAAAEREPVEADDYSETLLRDRLTQARKHALFALRVADADLSGVAGRRITVALEAILAELGCVTCGEPFERDHVKLYETCRRDGAHIHGNCADHTLRGAL